MCQGSGFDLISEIHQNLSGTNTTQRISRFGNGVSTVLRKDLPHKRRSPDRDVSDTKMDHFIMDRKTDSELMTALNSLDRESGCVFACAADKGPGDFSVSIVCKRFRVPSQEESRAQNERRACCLCRFTQQALNTSNSEVSNDSLHENIRGILLAGTSGLTSSQFASVMATSGTTGADPPPSSSPPLSLPFSRAKIGATVFLGRAPKRETRPPCRDASSPASANASPEAKSTKARHPEAGRRSGRTQSRDKAIHVLALQGLLGAVRRVARIWSDAPEDARRLHS